MLPNIRSGQERTMSLDESTLQDTRNDVVPVPRSTGPVTGDAAWIEPWLHARGSRPRAEYWDVETARWTARPVVPAPRQGD
jgi:hypothetical protein